MRILNIGFDKTLAGGKGLGDAVERHREYGRYLESLDIIVYTTRADGLTQPFKISENVTGYPTNSKSRFGFFRDVLKLARQIHTKYAFDIVVAQDPLGAGLVGYLLKRKYGCKLQINFHGDYWNNDYWTQKNLWYRILIPASRFWVRRADGIRVVSYGIKEKLIHSGISETKIAVLPTPVNFADFSKPDTTEIGRLKQQFTGKKIVLHAGRQTEEKNLESLIQHFPVILKQVPSAVLVLAGEGPLTSLLRIKVSEINLENKVIFVGPATPAQLACYMAACDVFVLPSYTESFGKVLIEAALAGKPVVATATTGALEIVENERSGFLIPVGEMERFAEIVITLLKDPVQSKALGEYGNKFVREKFDREVIVKGIIDFWHKILL